MMEANAVQGARRMRASNEAIGNRIHGLGLIGDKRTAGLIDAAGDLVWLCWPRFDSPACFASLLGTREHGAWGVAPVSFKSRQVRYLPGTNVLESTYTNLFGAVVQVMDFMPVSGGPSCVVRLVRGVKGSMRMRTRLSPRFDYGSAEPLVNGDGRGYWCLVTGADALHLRTSGTAPELIEVQGGAQGVLEAEWTARAGESCAFVLAHSVSYEQAPEAIDAEAALAETVAHWRGWLAGSTYDGPYREAVERSLLVLKAMTYEPSGGFVAAVTASLPEKPGGVRNWDYRYCWLRDTTWSLLGFLACGLEADARAWLRWLSRSVQGNPADLRILYGISGRREHGEWTADWLPGYEGSRPVHIGNAASSQLQVDVFGEVMDGLFQARCHGLYPLRDQSGESLEVPLLEHLETVWMKPGGGIWEMRDGGEHFVHSKVMAWVAFDRGIRMVEQHGMHGPVERWRKVREKIHKEVCARGYDRKLNSFTQCYGSRELDASLLMLPLVGFLPAGDKRVLGTVRRLERELMRDGLLWRYNTRNVYDGLPPGEGAFLACSFWMVDVLVMQGRRAEATALFERLLQVRNATGLLSEEFDPKEGLVGNFPQAIAHIGLVNAAVTIERGQPVRMCNVHK